LKSIAWIESGWAQGSYDPLVQYGEIGPVLSSHDCGYGIMQITTGMQNVTGVPNLDQAMIGGHFAFNIARGARILAEKWNLAPEYRPIVGSRNTQVIEDWYYALWGYNGFSSKNHPLSHDPNRPPYLCNGTQPRSNYPYQELIFGCIAHPPVRGGVPLWPAQQVTLPNLADPAFAGLNGWDAWNACVYNLQCGAMNLPAFSPWHTDPSTPSLGRSQVIGWPQPGVSSGRLDIPAIPPAVPGNASFTLYNWGTGVFAWRAIPTAGWLRLSRIQGVALGQDLAGVSSTISVSLDTTGLLPGDYSGEIRIESLYAATSPIIVSVAIHHFPDGTLVKGSGPPVYVIKGGLRRHIPNVATFDARGFNWASVISLPDSSVLAIPAGNPLPDVLADGSLIRGSGPAVYVMQGDGRRWVNNPDVMTACAYGWDAIQTLTNSVLLAVPEFGALYGQPCPMPSPPNGALWKGSGPAVYFMNGGLKRHVPNLLTFNATALRWGNVDQVADSTLNLVPEGEPLLDVLADGNLLKGSGPAVFVMQGGARRHVTSPSVMDACGYRWDAISTVDDGALNLPPLGEPLSEPPCPRLSPPSGSLLRGSGPAVYVMDGSVRRHVTDEAVFLSCDYLWGNVSILGDGVLAMIPAGDPLTQQPCP